ncbi:MAG: Holliday junction resolvase RuvX [Bacteroidaceae bacterium]|nr:Holliday junction resolvase RuvX [Bacteroidaceae bacterium]
MGRFLAIDYGKKRSGIAVTDVLNLISNPLTTVETTQLFDFIAEYVSKEDVERIIIGKPLQTNGEYSENMKRVEPFYNRLKKLYPSIIIEYFDERYTSVLAHQAILESGIKKKDRQNKALVDKISASIILEGYMEHLRFTNEHNN